MITLNVYYTAKPGQGEAFLASLGEAGVPAKCIAEEGCIQYDYFIAKDNKDLILLVERWKDKQAQNIHCNTEHMQRIRELKAIYIERTDIREYED